MRKRTKAVNCLSGKSISSTYDESNFLPSLVQDLNDARGRIIILSPFATVRGVQRLCRLLEPAMNRGTVVCAILAEPRGWPQRDSCFDSDDRARYKTLEAAIEMLQEKGVHVNLRAKMHEKLVVIDESILWEGSLNFLSWFDTSERLRRIHGIAEVKRAMVQHKIASCERCPGEIPLGPDLAQKRIRMGLTQSEIAARVNVNRKQIMDFESGGLNIRLSTVLRICAVLDQCLLVTPNLMFPAISKIIENGENGRSDTTCH